MTTTSRRLRGSPEHVHRHRRVCGIGSRLYSSSISLSAAGSRAPPRCRQDPASVRGLIRTGSRYGTWCFAQSRGGLGRCRARSRVQVAGAGELAGRIGCSPLRNAMIAPVSRTPAKVIAATRTRTRAGACASQLIALKVMAARQAVATKMSMVTAFAVGEWPVPAAVTSSSAVNPPGADPFTRMPMSSRTGSTSARGVAARSRAAIRQRSGFPPPAVRMSAPR
jgi:hypothetical protein